MLAVMADAFLSMVSSTAFTLLCAYSEPVDRAHKAISSIAAATACWLCSNRVNASAVAMFASVLSGISGHPSLSDVVEKCRVGKSNR